MPIIYPEKRNQKMSENYKKVHTKPGDWNVDV